MIRKFSSTVGVRGRSERKIWRQGRWLTLALTIMATCVTACDDDRGGGDEDGRTVAPSANTHRTTPTQATPSHDAPEGDPEPILIKTRVKGLTGEVLAGSVLGDSPFCPGGSVRHEHGSLEIGFPAINVFQCPNGQLRIGFGPGPDQMNNSVQTSDWKILDGTGRFARISGDGQMIVQFERAGSVRGQETFTGHLVVPQSDATT
jgi:hypothetical protein